MFTVTQAFYNESIRKMVIAFGSLFESVYVTRYETDGTVKEKIRVPLSYGSKEKFIWRLSQESSLSKNSRVQIVLPKMGFEITTFLYDPTRKLNRTMQRSDVVNGTFKKMYSEVPYNINFALYVFTRNMDDMLQIIEQIVPYFAPDYTITVKLNDLHQSVDIPVVLNNTILNEDYEGTFDTRRALIATFDFTAKTYIYPQICGATGSIIERTDLNFFDDTGTTAGHYVGDIGYTGDVITGSITEVIGNWP
jgi:T4-like virus Myoviridae tail sheath stabiliser